MPNDILQVGPLQRGRIIGTTEVEMLLPLGTKVANGSLTYHAPRRYWAGGSRDL